MSRKGYRADHCAGENCGRDFAHGMIVVRRPVAVKEGEEPRYKIYCENCCKKSGFNGQAVVYGGGDPSKVSAVSRDRAQRKLKKLERMAKRSRAMQR